MIYLTYSVFIAQLKGDEAMAETEKKEKNVNSPYISERFLKILHQYCSEKVTTKRVEQQYTYVFNAVCNYAKCDYLDISKKQICDYLSSIAKDTAIKSTNYDLSVLRTVSRYLDENAAEFTIEPRYLSLFSSIDVSFPDMQFRIEDLQTSRALTRFSLISSRRATW